MYVSAVRLRCELDCRCALLGTHSRLVSDYIAVLSGRLEVINDELAWSLACMRAAISPSVATRPRPVSEAGGGGLRAASIVGAVVEVDGREGHVNDSVLRTYEMTLREETQAGSCWVTSCVPLSLTEHITYLFPRFIPASHHYHNPLTTRTTTSSSTVPVITRSNA